jgi:iron complex outermembrane receptor protein
MDDKLKLNLGVRLPYFERDLNQHCYGFNGTTVYCSTIDPAIVQSALNLANAKKSAAATDPANGVPNSLNTLMGGANITYNLAAQAINFRFPFSQTYKYDKALPNAGVTYRLGDDHLFYLSYSQGFSAPKTDDLYTSSPETVNPETTTTWSGGYRFQTHSLTASLNGYYTDYKNRIVQSVDPNDPTLSIDRNVGTVDIYGFDGEIGWRPIDHLSLYASATIQKSEIKNNIAVSVSVSGVSTPAFLPTAGKQFVMTPEEEFSGRAQYDWGDFTFGAQVKYLSSRYISDVNDDRIPGYAKFDLDIRYKLPWFTQYHPQIQFNVDNLLDRDYISRSSTVNATKPTTVTLVNGGTATFNPSTPFLSVGSPRTWYLTLKADF